MPAQRLASVSTDPGANKTVFFNGSDESYIISVNILNIGNQACGVRLALTDNPIPAASDWMEYDTELMGKGVLEREGIMIGAGERLVAWSNTDLVSINVFGFPLGPVFGVTPILRNGDFSQPLETQGDPWFWDDPQVQIVNGELLLNGVGAITDASQDLIGIATGLTYNISFQVRECIYAGGSADANVTFTSGPNTEIITIPDGLNQTFSVNVTAGANTGSLGIIATDAELAIDNIQIRQG
jgi:hypothetical protein